MRISELRTKVLRGMSGVKTTAGLSFDDALGRVVDLFFARLQQQGSDLIRRQFDGEIVVDAELVYLPDDFRGFEPPLWLQDSSGNRVELAPLPYGTEEVDGASPLYYRLAGPRRVQFVPTPTDGAYDDDYVLAGWYYSRPSDLDLTDDMPWEGMLDTEIEDAVIMILSATRADLINPKFLETVGSIIDQQSFNREPQPLRCKAW